MKKNNSFIWGGIVAAGIIGIAFLVHHFNSARIAAPSVLVQIATPKYMTIPKILITYGTLNYIPEQIQPISVQNEALVQQIFVTSGQQVKKDDPLLSLSLTHASYLSLQTAKINVDYAQRELNRLIHLRAEYLATNADIQTAKENLAKAEAQLRSVIAQQQNENGKVLRAAADGTVINIHVTAGQIIAPATSILDFASNVFRQVQLGVEVEDVPQIHIGQKVIINSVQNKRLSFVGQIQNIGGQIDPLTGLLNIIIPVTQPSTIVAGTMVEGKIILNSGKKSLAVPRSAVLYQKNRPYLFVAFDNKAERRWVAVGEDDGQFVSILSGINEGEEVITQGNYGLKNDMDIRLE